MALKRKKESKLRTFTKTSHLSLNFYKEQGFVHHRLMSNPYVKLIKEAFKYYSKNFKPKSVAFRNSEGKPRHIVDIFRDKESPALSIFLDEEVQKILNFYLISNRTYIYTHSKMSFKQPLKKERSDWSPHQDNGYKNKGDIRDGFAVFLCLEDMHKSNGALQVFPESHKLGRLKHIKISENSKYGDHQYSVQKIPNNLKPYIVEAKEGDIIIFHSNLIHQSTSSLSNSKRLSLIAEIEEWDKVKLDDYAKIPILSRGESLQVHKKLLLLIKSLLSKQFYLNKISDYEQFVSLVRRLKQKNK